MSKHFTVPASVVALLALKVPADVHLFAEADAIVAAHRERQQALMESSTTILAQAEAEERDLTAAERKEVGDLSSEFDDIEAQIQTRERVAAQNAVLTAPRGRVTDPDDAEGDDPPPAQPRPTAAAPAPAPRATTRPAQPRVTAAGTAGFRHFGEFCAAVRNGSARGGDLDARLRAAAATSYGNEGTGGEGGFAVPPDYRSEMLTKVFGEDSLISRTDRLQSSSNTLTIPTDETTPWQTSGGIQAYWTSEASAITQSKPSLGETTIKLHKLACLVPMTDELMDDAPAMGAYLGRKAPEKMDFKISNSLIRGTGVGEPLGILSSPALVTVAIESGPQTADTIVAANCVKMLARLPTASRRTAIWLIHPDAEPQLPLMTIGDQPVYMPPGGMRDAPFGTLLGRPVIPHQVANTVGDLGDLMLVDFQQYLSVTKGSGVRQDVSMHLWFDQDIAAFKFTVRIAGQPWWAQPIAQRSGSNTQSPYVVLAAR